MSLDAGARLGPYEVIDLLGQGGMGEVYRARDTRLKREVALKVLPERTRLDPEHRARFDREARVLASLNHPNIATLLGIEESGHVQALVIELVEGDTLADRLSERRVASHLDVGEALRIARQIADALEAAHERGIIHRDLKPGNIKIRPDGTVKVLDFGLAKALESPGDVAAVSATTMAATHAHGAVLGTPMYMSPEQTRGLPVDKRTDVWAFGCVLFEMLTGRRSFDGGTRSDVVVSVLEREPDWDALPPNTPPAVRRLLHRCLEKDSRRRLRDISDARLELDETDRTSPHAGGDDRASPTGASYRRVAMVASVLVGLGLVGLLVVPRLGQDGPDLSTALATIDLHVEDGNWEAAFEAARSYEAAVPDNALPDELWERFSWVVTSIPTEPAGATVSRRPYEGTDDDWEVLGTTPLERVRMPFGMSILRFQLDGYHPLVRLIGGGVLVQTSVAVGPVAQTPQFNIPSQMYALAPEASSPDDMVPVPGWNEIVAGEPTEFRPFLLDRHEVTNRQFKAFIDAGGYERRELWEGLTFVLEGAGISREDAIARFVDRTGRPGPSTWEASNYPDGQDDHPVGGVSWYEAVAYARWAGRELPTAYHWRRAVASATIPWLLPASNLSGTGTAPVGSFPGIGWLGTYDMAGNVREWTFNAVGDARLILGGGWNDPPYAALSGNSPGSGQPPMDRSDTNGFRLAYLEEEPGVIERARLPIATPRREQPAFEPVSHEVFDALRSQYAYDVGAPLNASVDEVRPSRDWTRERITFDAAYGGERMSLYLYLPANGSPPYQTVVYWPGSAVIFENSIDDYPVHLDYVLKNGRAVAFPVFDGAFERGDRSPLPPPDSVANRDFVVRWVKDVRRSIDYLETRPELDASRLAFYGHSWGGSNGPMLLATESRIRAAVLYVAWLYAPGLVLPEIDGTNFAPRVNVPVLLLSGEQDTLVPLDVLARPLYRLLGTPDADKKHVIEPGGHFVTRARLIGETLAWLDKYLGPVR